MSRGLECAFAWRTPSKNHSRSVLVGEGLYVSAMSGREAGPIIVLIAGAFFFLSLVRRSER